MKENYSVVIRMGATAWTADVQGVLYDFRKMDTPQRKQWYGVFMDTIRSVYGKGGRPQRRSRFRPRRSFKRKHEHQSRQNEQRQSV